MKGRGEPGRGGLQMIESLPSEGRRAGRPSRHPVTVRYCEHPSINETMLREADRQGLSFAEVQRMVNRAGLRALNLMAQA